MISILKIVKIFWNNEVFGISAGYQKPDITEKRDDRRVRNIIFTKSAKIV